MVRPLGPSVRGRPPDSLVTARPLAGLEVRPLALMPRPPDPPVRVRPPRPLGSARPASSTRLLGPAVGPVRLGLPFVFLILS